MGNFLSNISSRKAALTVGIAFIASIFIVTLVDDFLLANFVVPGDIAALARDIEANKKLFGFAVVGYLAVLTLDSVIGLALYIVLRPANPNLAWFTAAFRLVYACSLIIGLFALAFQIINVYSYESIKLFGYLFFALHILVLGYSVFKSQYIPKSLGVLLMFASFTYVVFFVDIDLSSTIKASIMVIMALAELVLSIWLIAKRKKLP